MSVKKKPHVKIAKNADDPVFTLSGGIAGKEAARPVMLYADQSGGLEPADGVTSGLHAKL